MVRYGKVTVKQRFYRQRLRFWNSIGLCASKRHDIQAAEDLGETAEMLQEPRISCQCVNKSARESKANVFDGLLLPAILQWYEDAAVHGFIPRNGGENIEQKENVDHPMDFTQRSQSFIP